MGKWKNDGNYTIWLPQNKYHIFVYHPLYAPYEQDLVLNEIVPVFYMNPIYLVPLANKGKPYLIDSWKNSELYDQEDNNFAFRLN